MFISQTQLQESVSQLRLPVQPPLQSEGQMHSQLERLQERPASQPPQSAQMQSLPSALATRGGSQEIGSR